MATAREEKESLGYRVQLTPTLSRTYLHWVLLSLLGPATVVHPNPAHSSVSRATQTILVL